MQLTKQVNDLAKGYGNLARDYSERAADYRKIARSCLGTAAAQGPSGLPAASRGHCEEAYIQLLLGKLCLSLDIGTTLRRHMQTEYP